MLSSAQATAECTRQDQRTVVDQDEAAQTARLLAIVEELRRPVSGVSARPSSTLDLQTDSRSNVDERGWKQGVSRECGARGVAIRVRLDPHPSWSPATLLQPFISKKQPSWLPGLLPLPPGAFSASCAARIDEVLYGSRCDLRKAHSKAICHLCPEIAAAWKIGMYPNQRHPGGPSDRIVANMRRRGELKSAPVSSGPKHPLS